MVLANFVDCDRIGHVSDLQCLQIGRVVAEIQLDLIFVVRFYQKLGQFGLVESKLDRQNTGIINIATIL